MVRPIPINLLFHNAVYYKRLGKDDYEEIEYAEPINLNRIRIDPYTTIVKKANGDETALRSLLFYDCVKSLPLDIDFSENDKINFNGVDYLIANIEYLYDNRQLHHLEIGLK